MTENMSVRALINVAVYGVPGLMIFLGFFAYFNGSSVNDFGMMDVGIVMIILGFVFYVLELVAGIVATYYTVNDSLNYL